MQTDHKYKSPSDHRNALKVAMIYAIFSALWILFSDQLLLFFVNDPVTITHLQMMKGWVFVFVTALIVYSLLYRELTKVKRIEKAIHQGEQNYRAIFNATSEAILIHDVETVEIIDINRAMQTLYGYSYKESLKLTIEDLSSGVPPYTQKEALLWFKKAIEQGPQLFEWESKRKDGSKFWSEVNLKKTKLTGRYYMLAVIRDISERKNSEKEKSKLEMQIRQIQKMDAIGTLAGGIAHDFNNILSAIIGFTDMAIYELPKDSSVSEKLRHVLSAGKRARDLVNQILAFSRQKDRDTKPIKIAQPVQEAINLLRASIPAPIEIRKDIDKGAGVVLADPTEIHQVIMNLGTNSYHAMKEKGGTLGISLKNISITSPVKAPNLPAGNFVKIEVSDTGHGMDRTTAENIFTPYFTTKTKGEGTGLGLAVVHGIIKNAGGHITVYSEPGLGTTFTIYLPRIEEDDVSSENDVHAPLPTGTEKILFIDDEKDIADIGKEILSRLGYKVETKSNSLEALQVFIENPISYDLVVTDLSMPHLTGIELARKLLSVRPEIPVILCTGFSELINRQEASSIGIREYLMKPVLTSDLARAVRKVLDS